ncbi:MAG: lysophospholipid acyltransferase family protein [Gemmatimonadota bacterium]
MIRSAWMVLANLFITIPLSILVWVAASLGHRGGLYDWVHHAWSRTMLKLSGVSVATRGLEQVELERPQVFVSNHQSWYDVLSIAAVLPKRYRFVAKKELERVPFWGPAWKAAGHISIDRSNTQSAIAALDEAGRRIKEDASSIVIFPEGTRSADGELLPFKKGGIMLALRAGVDIVPVYVEGSREVLPRNGWRVTPGPIIVRFGAPIATSGMGEEERDALVARVRSAIVALRAEGRVERRTTQPLEQECLP